MIFHVGFEYSTSNRNEVHERFKRTGGMPPAGVTMVGRWHSTGGNRGFLVAETDEPEAIAKWLQDWTDLISFEVTPVLDDEQFTRVIG